MTNKKHLSKNEKKSIVEVIYAVFLGLFIATFFGLGVATFYKAPIRPDYSVYFSEDKAVTEETDSGISIEQQNYENAVEKYNSEMEKYNQNVSIITMTISIVAVAIGLFVVKNVHVISDGVLLGGLFTLIYSLIRGFMIEDSTFHFVTVTIGLIVVIVVGYYKFIKKR